MRNNVLEEPSSANDAASGDMRPILVVFSHLRWGFVYQRPQHLMSRAARDHRVYFIEEPWFHGDGPLPRLDLYPQPSGVTIAVPVLPYGLSETDVVEAQRRLLDELLAGHAGTSRIFWYYTPMALASSDHLEPDLCVYDCMDELSGFWFAPPELRRLEAALFDRADLVFTGGQSLYEAKRHRHPDVHAFPSSIDAVHFGRARWPVDGEPADQAALLRPRIGFFGVIDERMDMELVARLAELRPDWQLVMIGPTVKIDPAACPAHPNIHWLGGKSYDELPAYLAGWDAGFMSFALNDATRFISPTKTLEFLAAGVPVASTPIADVVRPYGERGLVEVARNAEEMAQALDRVMTRPRTVWLAEVDAWLSGTSWDRTWDAMHALMRRSGTQPIGDAALPEAVALAAAPSGEMPRAATPRGTRSRAPTARAKAPRAVPGALRV